VDQFDEALRAPDKGAMEKIIGRIRSILGNEEIRKGEQWADNFVNGDEPMATARLREKLGDFQPIANYAAAMVFIHRKN
jgi:hypothetical protein